MFRLEGNGRVTGAFNVVLEALGTIF